MKFLMLSLILSSSAFAGTSQLKIGGKCVDVPAAKFENGVQLQLWDCNGTSAQQFQLAESGTPSNPPPNPRGVCDGIASWGAGTFYQVGTKVVFQNQIFTASHENPGYNPTVSTWFWDAGAKCDSVATTPPPPTDNPPPANNGDKEIWAYYQTWSSPWSSTAANMDLAKLPPYITHVLLAFLSPSGGTLQFSSDASVVKEAIGIAQKQGKKVILSVGGASFQNWEAYNVNAIVSAANSLGVDGIDLDFEKDQTCGWSTGGTGCATDAMFIDIVKKTRAAWPRPKLLTAAVWSTGAFGEGDHSYAKLDKRQIGGSFGMWVNILKGTSDMWDALACMGYDAGNISTTGYDYRQAFAAYRKYYKGKLVMGVEAPPEAWQTNQSTPQDAAERAKLGQGIMLWSYQKGNGKELINAACKALDMKGCEN